MITQPTRITEISKTQIYNIFTNAYHNETLSGNILVQIADHLTQFASIQTVINKKTFKNIYKRDYSNWNDRQFIDDLSIQPWKKDKTDCDLAYNDLIWRLNGCINRHAPLKKLNKRNSKLS